MFGACVLTLAAVAVHVYIFYLEAVAWESPRARETFKSGSDSEVAATKFLAFNMGWYNLILALIALLGVVFMWCNARAVGGTLMLAGTGAMLGAAIVLAVASPQHRGAAFKQGVFPALAVLVTAITLM